MSIVLLMYITIKIIAYIVSQNSYDLGLFIENHMKNSSLKKPVLAILFVASSVMAFGQGTYYPPTICGIGQDDSTCGTPLRGTPKIPLKYQELQEMGSPVINNITNTTQQITQVVQPNTFKVSGTGSGQTTATAQADCGGGTILGGGGTCNDDQGLVAVAGSSPVGNSWVIGCQSLNYKPVFATATAICSAN